MKGWNARRSLYGDRRDTTCTETKSQRWLRFLPEKHAGVDDDTAMEEIEYSLRSTMQEDDARGADGEWVGLVGFSQGATM